jgi:hypothetical protein
MNYTRLTSAFVAAAAVGSLAIGMAGAVSADPDPGADSGNTPVGDSRFTVINASKFPITFTGYSSSSDNAHKGPAIPYVIHPQQSAWFDITIWSKGGHETTALFKLNKGTGGVSMKASSAGSQAWCSSDNGCSLATWAPTPKVSLY